MNGRSSVRPYLARVRQLLTIALGVLIGANPVGDVHGGGVPSTGSLPTRAAAVSSQTPEESPAPRYQTPDEALATDLALTAQAMGWTEAEAAAYARAEEVIDRLAVWVASERPDAFVGSALAPQPDGAPRLFVKGSADPELLAQVQSVGIPVDIIDGQPYSLEELEAKKTAVHAGLLSAGYREVVTAFDLTRAGLIEVTVRRQVNLPGDSSAVLSLLPAELRSGVEVTLSDTPTVAPAGAFGGMWLRRNDGSRYCTSGWSVLHPDGRSAVSGAGHCDGL